MDNENKIIYQAAQLFADNGFEHVSLEDIARAAGLLPDQLRDYFPTTEAVLSAIYQLYKKRIFEFRPTLEQYEPILLNGTAEEILDIFNFGLPEPVIGMFAVHRVVWGRKDIDPAAMRIHKEYVQAESLSYITAVLYRGITLGRLVIPDDIIPTLTLMIFNTRAYSASAVISDPRMSEWRDRETEMNRMLTQLIVLNPPSYFSRQEGYY